MNRTRKSDLYGRLRLLPWAGFDLGHTVFYNHLEIDRTAVIFLHYCRLLLFDGSGYLFLTDVVNRQAAGPARLQEVPVHRFNFGVRSTFFRIGLVVAAASRAACPSGAFPS